MSAPWMESGAIGTSFFSPDQAAYRAGRRRFGGPDDPDAGGYSLARIHWNKETGTSSFSTTDPAPDGWYDQQGPADVAPEPCDCPDGGGCGC